MRITNCSKTRLIPLSCPAFPSSPFSLIRSICIVKTIHFNHNNLRNLNHINFVRCTIQQREKVFFSLFSFLPSIKRKQKFHCHTVVITSVGKIVYSYVFFMIIIIIHSLLFWREKRIKIYMYIKCFYPEPFLITDNNCVSR